MTEDGVPVLIHDPTVDRTTDGSGEVTFLSYSRIEELDACSWYGGAWSQCKVPSLEEALIVAREYDGILVLDLKPPISRSEVANILRIVECTGMLKRTMVMSWDGEIIWSVRRLAPSVPVGPVLLRRENPQVYSGYGYRFAAVPRTLIQAEPEYVSALAGRGMATMVWTINNESDVVSLSALGVRIFLSDVPLFIDDSRPNLK